MVHVRTLKIKDDVLCVKYSNSRSAAKLLVAVALLDCTIKARDAPWRALQVLLSCVRG